MALLAGTLSLVVAAPAHAQAPTMEFELVSYLVVESDTTPEVIKVQLSAALTQQTTVGIRVRASGTTAEPADYTLSATTLTFAAGDTEKSFTVDAAADLVWEGNEVFWLELVPPAGAPYTLGSVSVTEAVIVDDSFGPPTGLSVTAGNARLGLSWTAPGSPGGYDVHYTSAAASGMNSVANNADASGNNPAMAWVAVTRSGTTASQSIGSLSNGTAYRVRVRAKGSGETSDWVFGTGTPSASVPAAPTALSVTNGDGRLILSWTAPTGTLTAYDVSYTSAPSSGTGAVANGDEPAGADPALAWVAVSRTGTTAAQTVPDLTIGTAYRVRVRARNTHGAGAWVFGTGTPATPVVGFDQVYVLSIAEGAATATVTLDIAPTLASASSVRVRLRAAAGTAGEAGDHRFTGMPRTVVLPANSDSVTINLAENVADNNVNDLNDSRFFDLEAVADAPYTLGTLKFATVIVVDDEPPAAPGLSLIGEGDGQLTARWTKPVGPVDRYEMRYKEASAADQTATTPGDPSTGWVTSAQSGTSATISGLSEGKSYHVQVRANDGSTQTGNGWGAWSATQTGTPAHPATPREPWDFRAVPNSPGELKISWRSPLLTRGGVPLGECCADHELHYTTAAKSAVGDTEPASGSDPATGWVKADFRRALIGGLADGTVHRLRGRVHNAVGAGKWAFTVATPLGQLDATAPTVSIPRRYGLPLRLEWRDPAAEAPRAYEVQFTSATAAAAADDAAPVGGADPAVGWVDVLRVGSWIYMLDGWNVYDFPSAYGFKGATDYRFRVRAVYRRYVTKTFAVSDVYSDWGVTEPYAVSSHTAVGVYGYLGYENRGSVPVRVDLAAPVAIEVSVDYGTSDRTAVTTGTAEAGTYDYRPTSGTLTFAPGETEKWINVPIVDDVVADSGEEFLITLSNPQPAKYVTLGCSCVAHHKTNKLATSWVVTIYNHEADLAALTIEGAAGDQGPFAALDIGTFTADTTAYTVTVPYDTTHARLTPTALHDKQKLRAGTSTDLHAVASGTATAAIPLEVGDNTLVVEAFLPGETPKTYTVTVTRQEPVTPGPVSGLTLTADGDKVIVSWTPPDIGSAPNGYIVHLRPQGGKTGSGKTKRPKAKKTKVTYHNLQPGRTYKVWVRAHNAAGKGQRTHATITLP